MSLPGEIRICNLPAAYTPDRIAARARKPRIVWLKHVRMYSCRVVPLELFGPYGIGYTPMTAYQDWESQR